jgi:hypothetical protein
MLLDDSIHHDIHECTLAHEIGGKFMEIMRKEADLFLNNRSCREIMLFRGMSCRNHIAISQVKPSSTDGNFARLFRHSLVLSFRQDSHRYIFRSKKCVLAERRRFGSEIKTWRYHHDTDEEHQ